ncbi:MAG: hypothetical protein RIQ54_125 [Candidatus Parcubacteria bacterium]|jgi:uncharacterized membrane protein
MEQSIKREVFSISAALSFGWETLKNHTLLLIATLLLVGVTSFISNELSRAFHGGGLSLTEFVFNVASWLVGCLVQLLLYKAILLFVEKRVPESLSQLLPSQQTFLTYLVATVLFVIGSVVSFILFIIPGIFFMLAFGFYGYIVADEMGIGPIAALKHSAVITKGNRWQLLLFGFTLLGINILGALAFGVGLLISVPISMLATGFVYRFLSDQASHLAPAAPVSMQAT